MSPHLNGGWEPAACPALESYRAFEHQELEYLGLDFLLLLPQSPPSLLDHD